VREPALAALKPFTEAVLTVLSGVVAAAAAAAAFATAAFRDLTRSAHDLGFAGGDATAGVAAS